MADIDVFGQLLCVDWEIGMHPLRRMHMDGYGLIDSISLRALPIKIQRRETPLTLAVVFVPAGHEAVQFISQCMAYCANRGYQVAGVVTDNWTAAIASIMSCGGGVVVVARPEHLAPDREPRIEVVTQPGGLHRVPATPRQRRARRV